MDEFLHSLMGAARLALFCGVLGACFAFGVVLVCRLFGWAPVNFTVHTHINPPSRDEAP